MQDQSILTAFLDGINEVFSIMFTESCEIRFLNKNNKVNIYNETKGKEYSEPINLVAKIVESVNIPENPNFKNILSITVTIPTKQLIDNNIPHETLEDLENLEKALITYKDVTYEVSKVTLKTLIVDKWQMYQLDCIHTRGVTYVFN